VVIEHRYKVYDDRKMRPYEFSRRLVKNFFNDEFEVFVVYGMPEGIGKTAYISHVQADVFGYFNCHDKQKIEVMWKKDKDKSAPIWDSDWEEPKKWILYPPEQVVKICKTMLEREERNICFHWDDAGTWLNAMDFHDPFVIAFMKYLSLARSNWAGIILSTPVEEWVLKKLRTALGVIHIKITKLNDDTHIWKPRIAEAYKAFKYHPGSRKTYYPKQWQDYFIGIMPDNFYKWYKPRRDL